MRTLSLLRAATLSGGRPTMPHESTRNVLRYSPTPRRPYAPAQVNRYNLLPADLEKEWGGSRGKHGSGHVNSGYSKLKEIQWEDNKVPITPVHELSKFMPDITVPGIQSTPVSLMHARHGHRVSHDLIHSYDPRISELEKYPREPRLIDHDNITPYDDMRFGLHPQAIGSRSRIYRYLRRSPYVEEKSYYRNYVQPFPPPQSELEQQANVIAFANQDDLESATDVYRKLVHPPSREVFLSMMQCCERLGLLADAFALLDDGYRINRRLVRVPTILSSLLNTAMKQPNASSVMRVLSYVIGNRTDNIILRTEIPDEWKSRLGRRALRWYLDNGYSSEARNVYDWMRAASLLQYDTYEAMAKEVATLLSDSPPSPDTNASTTSSSSNSSKLYDTSVDRFTDKGILAHLTQYHAQYCFLAGVGGSFSVAWLRRQFDGADIDFFVRLHTTSYDPVTAQEVRLDGTLDKARIVQQTHAALIQLFPEASRESNHIVLPYLQKSKVSSNNPNIRTIPHPGELQRLRSTPSKEGYTFGYRANVRYVREACPVLVSGNVQHMYTGRRMVQSEAPIDVWFCEKNDLASSGNHNSNGGGLPPTSLDPTSALPPLPKQESFASVSTSASSL